MNDQKSIKWIEPASDDVRKHGLGIQTSPDEPQTQQPADDSSNVEPIADSENQDGQGE